MITQQEQEYILARLKEIAEDISRLQLEVENLRYYIEEG